MKSKTSCFNKTLFLKNITRFWPVWAFYMVVLFFSMPLNLYLETRYASGMYVGNSVADDKLYSLIQCVELNLSPLIVFFFAILCALAVFSYLYNARSCNMIHAFPVKRGELFFTNYLNGLLFMIVPQIIAFLMSMFVCVFRNITSVEYLFFWLMYVMGMTLFFYSCAVFFCMLTGHHFAGVVYYFLGNTIYVILKALISSITETLGYGLSVYLGTGSFLTGKDISLSPIVFMVERVGISWERDADYNIVDITMRGGNVVIAYLVVAVVLIGISMLLYKRRQLECAGDILSLYWLKPVFRWLAAFGAGTGFSILFTLIFFEDTKSAAPVLIVCSVAFSFVFFFLAEMLLRKKFRVFEKKRCIEWVVCGIVILFILVAIDADLFRLERRVPNADDVRAVQMSAEYDIVATDPEDIETIRNLHQTIIDSKKEYEDYYYANGGDLMDEDSDELQLHRTTYVTLQYYLNNGKKMSRRYHIPLTKEYLGDSDSAAGKVNEIQSDPETYLKYLICENYQDVQFIGGEYTGYRKDGKENYRSLSEEEAQTLFEAIKKDIEAGNYPYGIKAEMVDAGKLYFNGISLQGQIKGEKKTIFDILSDQSYQMTEEAMLSSVVIEKGSDYTGFSNYFSIYESCEHTIQALKDLGMIQDESDLITEEEYYANEMNMG